MTGHTRGENEMARHTYRIVIEFIHKDGETPGKLDGTVNALTHIKTQLEAHDQWLARKEAIELSRIIVRDDGHVMYTSKPRQETQHERGLANADNARTQLANWK
jgi:hypothetical protein